MKSIFCCTDLDTSAALPQLRTALERRMQHAARQRLPRLWAATDRISGGREPVLQERTPAQRRRTRFLGVLCLLLGIFLFVPGLMRPQELLVPLLMGAVGIGAGIGAFIRTRKHRPLPFDKEARRLLQARADAAGAQVVLSTDGVTLPDGETAICDGVFETADLLLVTFGHRAAVLQKCELQGGDLPSLRQTLQGIWHKV